METNYSDIETINKFLNNELLKDAKLDFLNRLERDMAFRLLFEEQKSIVEGIKRYGLKKEINVGYRSYILLKKLRSQKKMGLN